MKKLLCLLLCFGLLLAAAPIISMAEDAPLEELWIGNVDLLNSAATDYPTGVSFDAATRTLTLNGANITEHNAGIDDPYGGYNTGLYAEGKTDLTIVIEGENSITSGEETIDYTIRTKIRLLTLQGTGSLTLYSADDALDILGTEDDDEETGNLTIKSGSYNIVSEDIAIDVSGNMIIEGGSLTVNGKDDDAIEVSDDLTISDGVLNLTAIGKGLDISDKTTISGGKITIVSTGDAIEVSDDLIISGGELDITSTNDIGMDISWGLSMTGGKIIIRSVDEGIQVDDAFHMTGGTLDITASDDFGINVITGPFDMFGGSLKIVSTNSSIFASEQVMISGGTVDAKSASNNAIYTFNSIIISKDVTLSVEGGSSALRSAIGSATIDGVNYNGPYKSITQINGVVTAPLNNATAALTTLKIGTVDMLTADASDYPAGVSFDKATSTLTLNNATLNEDYGNEATMHISGDCTIVLIGENFVKDIGYGIDLTDGTQTFKGSGSLTITTPYNGIYDYDNMFLNVTEQAKIILDCGASMLYSDSGCTLINGVPYDGTFRAATITSAGITNGSEKHKVYSLWVDNVDLLNSKVEDYPTGVSYDAATRTLTLTDARLLNYYPIPDSDSGAAIYISGDVNINLVGENIIGVPFEGPFYGIYYDGEHNDAFSTISGDTLRIQGTVGCIAPSNNTIIGPVKELELYALDTAVAFNNAYKITFVSGTRGYFVDTDQGLFNWQAHSTVYLTGNDAPLGYLFIQELRTGNNSQQWSMLYGSYVSSPQYGRVFSADISWGSMEFTYTDASQGEWNAETHRYENASAAEWSYEQGANVISVTNHSNSDITVGLSYAADSGFGDIEATFTEDSGTANDSFLELATAVGTSVDNAPTASAQLTLEGALSSGTSGKIGTVTLRLALPQ